VSPTTKRTAVVALGAALVTWLSAAVYEWRAERPAARAPDASTTTEPRSKLATTARSSTLDRTPTEEPFLAPYGEEVSDQEDAQREALRSNSRAQLAELEQRWAADRVSVDATQLSEQIRQWVEERGLAPELLRSLECRASLCRLQLGLGDPAVMASLPAVAAKLAVRYWMRHEPGDPPTLDILLERTQPQ
jgi:hypothetical protein